MKAISNVAYLLLPGKSRLKHFKRYTCSKKADRLTFDRLFTCHSIKRNTGQFNITPFLHDSHCI